MLGVSGLPDPTRYRSLLLIDDVGHESRRACNNGEAADQNGVIPEIGEDRSDSAGRVREEGTTGLALDGCRNHAQSRDMLADNVLAVCKRKGSTLGSTSS